MSATTTDVLNKLDSTFTSVEEVTVTNTLYDATIQAAAYLEVTDTEDMPTGDIVDNAIATWSAGLLWNLLMDSRQPNYTEDRKGLTTGDRLIQSAKDMLSPYTGLSDTGGKRGLRFMVISGEDEEDE